PLLIKVIDAAADLSIQVHPTDVTALGGGLGKTEAWHVLHADPGASLYLGLRADVTIWELQRLARAGASTAGLLNKVPAHIGTTYLLPAGTVHALGAGVVVYEIQQPSAITYRLDDWGRVDSLGRPRDLHLDEAFAVIDAESRPEPLPPAPLPRSPGRRTTLVSCAYFAAERIELGPGDKIRLEAPGSPQTVTCLSGSADVRADGASVILASGQTAALLASAASATLTARTTAVLLRGWAPTERPILIAMPKS
ncbi:MAG: class I mannose-6-phosphate isomerase, partial [Thermomicrobiales bacterium]